MKCDVPSFKYQQGQTKAGLHIIVSWLFDRGREQWLFNRGNVVGASKFFSHEERHQERRSNGRGHFASHLWISPVIYGRFPKRSFAAF